MNPRPRTDSSDAAPATLLLPSLLAALLVGCQPGATAGSQPALPTVTMSLGEKTFTLEVANTEESRERGLMRRDSMPSDHGMIFVFAAAQPLNFYMKNTRIPLDIVFLDAGGRVISIKQMKPYDLSLTPSGGAALWAIELNQGAAASAGLKVGDQLQIPDAARKPAD
jgi:uncharacterized membrane protein (UPF0127 family)